MEPDELHICHLGITQYFLGSVLWLLVFDMPGSSDVNMDRVWKSITEFYKGHRTSSQFSVLRISMFTNPLKPKDHYPCLKGKGIEIKNLVPALAMVWDTFADLDEPYCYSVKRCFEALQFINATFDSPTTDYVLPLPQVGAFRNAIDVFLSHYSWLANRSDQRNELLFNVVTKHHWLWHIGERAMYLHPRIGATMIDEDFVGHVKEVVQACTSGMPSHNVQASVCDKYRYAMSLC